MAECKYCQHNLADEEDIFCGNDCEIQWLQDQVDGLGAALENCVTLIGQMTPQAGQMALPDYELLNKAPLDAQKALKEAGRVQG